MIKPCKHYLDIWTEWQRLPVEEPLRPDVREAIEHIASCPECLKEAPAISADIAFKPDDESRKTELMAFVEKEMQDGIAAASRAHPAIATYLARNKHPFERFCAVKRALSRDFVNETLPLDVMYTICSGIREIDWTELYIKEFGVGRHGRMASQPKAAIEFHIDTATEEILFNTRPILGVTLASKRTWIQVEATPASLPAAGRAYSHGTRIATIYADDFCARALVDPHGRELWVVLPNLPEYIARLPTAAILSEYGTPRVETACRISTGYEVSFTALESGSYFLAIDIIEMAKTTGSPKPRPGSVPRIPDRWAGTLESETEQPPPRGQPG